MLGRARDRASGLGLCNVEALLELDAQSTGFAARQFDIAVAMFVASVVPDPCALVAELRRVVRPGGTLFFVNHFARERGVIGWGERALAPVCARLGWHADFRLGDMFSPADLAAARIAPMPPFGLFRLVALRNGFF